MPGTNGASAADAGTVDIGGDITVNRLGFGAMRITGRGIWGEPADRNQARAVAAAGRRAWRQLHRYGRRLWPQGERGAHRRGTTSLSGGSGRRHQRWIRTTTCRAVASRRPARLRRAQALTPIASIQNRYNPGDRSSEALVDLCVQEHMAFLPWAPVQNLDSQLTLTRIAGRHGATPYQVALAWLLARSETMLPIPGTGSVHHLEENLAAAGLRLVRQEIAALDDLG